MRNPATINRIPVLLLPSDYYVTRHQGPVLQQLEHPVSADLSVNDCFRPVSRFFDRISRPPKTSPSGGLPLPDAVPASVRLRGPGRLSELRPQRERRPAREPVPQRRPVRR